MNKISKLFEEGFVSELFRREVLPQYPSFSAIGKIAVRPYKDQVWETTYHVVIAYDVFFKKADGQLQKIPIVCSAHSDEPRANVYQALKYLWSQAWRQEGINLPRPLFYSQEFNGAFYRGIKGENLLYYIKKGDRQRIEEMITSAAKLLARLHNLPTIPALNFNPENARIRSVVPGVEHILQEIDQRYQGKYTSDLRRIYEYFQAAEEEYFSQKPTLSLIHGDFHPENLIRTGAGRIGLIDFTDFCLGDFARDLGTFLQQLDYKITRKMSEAAYAAQMKKIFLEKYWRESGRPQAADLEKRLELYYNWTAIRTAVFWFLRFESDEVRASALLQQVKENLAL